LALVLGIPLVSSSANGQWLPDGVPICTADTTQYAPAIVSDGAGGAIITWEDYRSGTHYDIYTQRLDAAGVPQWTADGVALCAATGDQVLPQIVSDGAGGAIVTWQDRRSGTSYHIYAQRVDTAGSSQWTADGVALSTAANYPSVTQDPSAIIPDGAGGAIVAWSERRSAIGTNDIYVRSVNASGVPQWAANGVALSAAGGDEFNPTIASDGAGGAIVTWTDGRNGFPNYDIYVRRVNASGVPQWTANGVALCTAADFQGTPTIASDGAGGAIASWHDYRSGSSLDVYARRVDAAGIPQWTADGVALCSESDNQYLPTIVSDGAGGAIVTWQDGRSGTSDDIYAQRVDASGVPNWMASGVALCTAGHHQMEPEIISDGTGGAIATWIDLRNGDDADIYARRIDASGAPQWTADGVAMCTAGSDQENPRAASDGAGGAIVAWTDLRNGNYDIYAQHVSDSPTAVAILSFDASEASGVVTLRSSFRSDLGVEAVNVYRGSGAGHDPLIMIERVDDVRGDRFEYVDRGVAPGQTYRYRIGVIDADGEFFSPVVTVSVEAITGELSQNQPNPFNPTTTIRFVLPVREHVTLAIYDAGGRLIRTLVNEVRAYGEHDVIWDGRDDGGAAMASGVYFYQLRAGKRTESKKMVLLK